MIKRTLLTTDGVAIAYRGWAHRWSGRRPLPWYLRIGSPVYGGCFREGLDKGDRLTKSIGLTWLQGQPHWR